MLLGDDLQMTNAARTLWIVLILNAAMIAGVLIYGLGNLPWSELKGALKWFCLGTLVSGIGLSFAYVIGIDVPNESPDLDAAPPQMARLIWGVINAGLLGLILLAVGLIETVSMLGR